MWIYKKIAYVIGGRMETIYTLARKKTFILPLACSILFLFSSTYSMQLAVATDNKILLYRTDNLKQKPVILKAKKPIHSILFSPNEKRLAAVTPENNTITIWNTENLNESPITLDGGSPIVSILFTRPRGIGLLVNTGKNITAWDLDTLQKKPLFTNITPKVVSMLSGPPTESLLILNLGIRIVVLEKLRKKEVLNIGGQIRSMLLSPDEKLFALNTSNSLLLWNTKNWKKTFETFHSEKPISSLLFSPDGKLFVVHTGNKLLIWNAKNWKALKKISSNDPISSLLFSPDGKWLAVDFSKKIALLNPNNLERKSVLFKLEDDDSEDENIPNSILFSPDGKLLAKWYHNKIKIWNINNLKKKPITLSFQTKIQTVAWKSGIIPQKLGQKAKETKKFTDIKITTK